MENNLKLVEETNNSRAKLMGVIKQLALSYSLVDSSKYLKSGSIYSIKNVQAQINLLKISKESKDNEIQSKRSDRKEKLASLIQAIRIEETKEEIYRRTLSDLEKQLGHLKGSEVKHHEQKKEFQDIEKQLGTI